MEDRQDMEQHVVAGKAPGFDQGLSVGGEVFVRQHGAFGAAGRAGCVKDCRQIVGCRRDIGKIRVGSVGASLQAAVAVGAESFDPQIAHCRQRRRQAIAGGRVADQQARFGVVGEIGDLCRHIGRVERQIDRPGAQAGEIEHQAVDGLCRLHRDAVALLHAERREAVGKLRGAGQEVAIGQADAGFGGHKDGLGGRRGLADPVEEMIAHAAAISAAAGKARASRLTGPEAVIMPALAKASWFFSMSSSL